LSKSIPYPIYGHYEEARTGVETASKAGHSFPGRGVKVPLFQAGGYRLKRKGPKKKRSSKLQTYYSRALILIPLRKKD